MAAEVGVSGKGVSLLWRILLATALVVTLVFALTGRMVQRYAARVSESSLEEEIRTSLEAYDAVWSMRVRNLTSISRVISSMSDVRAAFMTRDRATIRDTAEQLWAEVSEEGASFLVLDPTGQVIASLGGDPGMAAGAGLTAAAAKRFPGQATGYVRRGAHLYYVVFTPVYVQAAHGQALLNILLVAFDIDDKLASSLKRSTHGSNFVFAASDAVFASTLPGVRAAELRAAAGPGERMQRMKLEGADYLLLCRELRDPVGGLLGKLFIIRSFSGEAAVVAELQRNVGLFWGIAILISLALTSLLARRILKPVIRLDRAAEQVIRQNYQQRVPVETNDELGRLAMTFNTMCESIESARAELVRQEQIATIGRLSSSIVHDLRNPLAAIYGGAEMLMDADLSPGQSRRLAGNIYSASRRIQELLQELVDVSRSKAKPIEVCGVAEIAAGAVETVARTAEERCIEVKVEVPGELQVMADRERLERVFLNLINNALDAMPNGGRLRIYGRPEARGVTVGFEDSGPGIADEVWPRLFQPFASFGKKNGLGLGLALARQTVVDHGGDLWAEKTSAGARFVMRLPLPAAAKTEDVAVS